MHEIPNLPFPSLHEPEQTTTQQAGAQQPEPKEATGSRKVDSEDWNTRRTDRVESANMRFPHRLNRESRTMTDNVTPPFDEALQASVLIGTAEK